MGLILEGKDFAVISDILGDEDHLGDMDFKVAGTADGITALQMDIKVAGITEEIMRPPSPRRRTAAPTSSARWPRRSMTRARSFGHAPRIETMSIPKDKIREVIGTGGKVIREIVAETGAKVDIDDEGVIKISSSDLTQIEAARKWIRGIVAEPEPGTVYTGKVASIVDFGAFVTFMPGKDGLVHVSEIKNERVENVRDVLSVGQEVKVKLLEVDQRGKVRLSMRLVDQENGEELHDTAPPRELREGGDRGPRGDRGDPWPSGRGGDRDRGPRRDGGGRGGDRDRGPRGEGRGDRGPRREREGGNDEGPAPEFAPRPFLTGNDEEPSTPQPHPGWRRAHGYRSRDVETNGLASDRGLFFFSRSRCLFRTHADWSRSAKLCYRGCIGRVPSSNRPAGDQRARLPTGVIMNLTYLYSPPRRVPRSWQHAMPACRRSGDAHRALVAGYAVRPTYGNPRHRRGAFRHDVTPFRGRSQPMGCASRRLPAARRRA